MTSEIDRLASRSHKDWRALLRTRANVLVTGPHDVIDEFAETCAEELRQPVIIVSAAEPLALRWSSTLVITNLHLLDRPSQRMLNAWIRDPENSDTQIISLTSERLLPLVDEGSFDRDLFYRLNTIHLELTAA
jgi:hypothetical protein